MKCFICKEIGEGRSLEITGVFVCADCDLALTAGQRCGIIKDERGVYVPQWQLPKESNIVKGILKYLKDLPGVAWKQHGGAFSAGLPDIFYIRRRQAGGVDVFAFEVKRPGNKPTALQQQVIDDLRAAGVRAIVVNSKAQVRKEVERET